MKIHFQFRSSKIQTALIPPSTFLLVLPQLHYHTSPPIRSRTFTSGLSVLHTPSYTHASFAARLASLLALTGPKTTMEVAAEEGMTVGLAGEMIGAEEGDGDICRDEGSTGAGGAGGGGVGGGGVGSVWGGGGGGGVFLGGRKGVRVRKVRVGARLGGGLTCLGGMYGM